MNLPTDFDDVRDYCIHHPLNRPSINWRRTLTMVAAFEIAFYAVICMFSLSASSFLIIEEGLHLLIFLLFGGQVLRFAVKVYQRYAPEPLRRQCTCKPTCSEYALLALRKYWWPIAALLIVRRVAHTCQLPGYKTDYP